MLCDPSPPSGNNIPHGGLQIVYGFPICGLGTKAQSREGHEGEGRQAAGGSCQRAEGDDCGRSEVSKYRWLGGFQDFEEHQCLRGGAGAQVPFQVPRTAMVHGQGLVPAAQALIGLHEGAAAFLGAGRDIHRPLGPLGTLGPGLNARTASGNRPFGLGEQVDKSPEVHPAGPAVQAQSARLPADRRLVAEQLAEPVERGGEGLLRRVPVRVGPEEVGQAAFAHVLPAKGNQRLQEGQRLFLGLAGKMNGVAFPQHLEAAEGDDLDWPGPRIDLHRYPLRGQTSLPDERLHVLGFDVGRDGPHAQLGNHRALPRVDVPVAVLAAQPHRICQAARSFPVSAAQEVEVGFGQVGGELHEAASRLAGHPVDRFQLAQDIDGGGRCPAELDPHAQEAELCLRQRDSRRHRGIQRPLLRCGSLGQISPEEGPPRDQEVIVEEVERPGLLEPSRDGVEHAGGCLHIPVRQVRSRRVQRDVEIPDVHPRGPSQLEGVGGGAKGGVQRCGQPLVEADGGLCDQTQQGGGSGAVGQASHLSEDACGAGEGARPAGVANKVKGDLQPDIDARVGPEDVLCPLNPGIQLGMLRLPLVQRGEHARHDAGFDVRRRKFGELAPEVAQKYNPAIQQAQIPTLVDIGIHDGRPGEEGACGLASLPEPLEGALEGRARLPGAQGEGGRTVPVQQPGIAGLEPVRQPGDPLEECLPPPPGEEGRGLLADQPGQARPVLCLSQEANGIFDLARLFQEGGRRALDLGGGRQGASHGLGPAETPGTGGGTGTRAPPPHTGL